MKVLYGRSEEVAAFVASCIPRCRELGFGNCTAIGLTGEDRKLVGGFVYHNYQPGAGVIEISAALKRKDELTREVLCQLFSYPFVQLGCQLVYAMISATNTRLAKQSFSYGFEGQTIPRFFGRQEDALLLTLTIEQWITNRFNKRYNVDGLLKSTKAG